MEAIRNPSAVTLAAIAVSTFSLTIALISLSVDAAASIQELQPKPHESYEVKEEKIYFRVGNAGLILETGGEESVIRYYSERGASIGNPFGSLGDGSQDYTVFVLTLLNRGKGAVTFTPRYVTLKIGNENFFPMDFPVLLGLLEGLDSKKGDILQKSIFHSSETVRPNQIVTKLLVFPGLPKKFKELVLEFDYLFFGEKEIRPKFYFLQKK
jgi:hypothetical protein